MSRPHRSGTVGSIATAALSAWVESLERRIVAHGGGYIELPPGMTLEDVNALPLDSPLPFGLVGHSGDRGASGDAEPLAPPAPFTTIRNSGPITNRIDIAVVGDGYTSSQLGTYATHAANFLSGFFNEAPFDRYASYFNVHRVDVVSVDGGVDNDPTQGISRNTAMGFGFFGSGIERLLTANVNAVASYAVNAPQADQIIGIANSTKYGGAGYPSAELSTYAGGNASSLEIVKHEFAHALGDLADEYDYADGTVHSTTEPSAPNVSVYNAATLAAQQRKWFRWLDLPNVDAFEGASYAQYGVYRPTSNSKMRSLGRPFEEVNVEQLILKIYASVRPIDSATPGGTYQTQTSTFSVDPVDPATGAPLSVQWYVDDVAVPGATGLTFTPGAAGFAGNHVLKVVVQDKTTAVRDEAKRSTLMTDSRTWTLADTLAPSVTASAFAFNVLPRMEATFTFSERVSASLQADDLVLVNTTLEQTIPAASIALAYDPATNVARFTFPGFVNGVLPDGNYTATFTANAVIDDVGNVLPTTLAEPATLTFFFKNGDATRDRTTGFDDLLVLAKHYNQTGHTFTGGNFDYSPDGLVDFADLLILAKQYNSTVAAAALRTIDGSLSPAAHQSSVAATRQRVRRGVASDLL